MFNVSPLISVRPVLLCFLSPTSDKEIQSVISSFVSKGCSLSRIPVFIIKSLAPLLSHTLASLFNASVEEGCFPHCLKTAFVFPLLKGGDPLDLDNYRPISTLPILSKIFEKIMMKQMLLFLDKFKIIVRCQFGFRAGLSTIDAVHQYLTNVYSAFEESDFIATIFLDLRKAFDLVDLDVLLNKLNHLGFRGRTLQWFESYLKGRKQVVVIDGVSSEELVVRRGVPQGSTLGPILFILYINDMCRSSDVLSFTHFADDTTVSFRSHDLADLINIVGTELEKVRDWLLSNRLCLNIDKTSVIFMSNRSMPDTLTIRLDGRAIRSVDSCRFLGLIIDRRLSFEAYVDHLCSKLSSIIGVIRRISSVIPSYLIRNLYFSLFYSRLIYGITDWGNSGVTIVNRVRVLQRRMLSLMRCCDGAESKRGFFTFDTVYRYYTLISMFKIVKSDENCFSYVLNGLRCVHDHNTRFSAADKFNTPICKTSKSHSSFLFRGIALWNELPTSIRCIVDIENFKRIVKSHIMIDN